MIRADAEVNARDPHTGRTALMEAVLGGNNREVVRTLLQAGADVTAMDKRGWTALYAAARNDPEQTRQLIAARTASGR